MTIQRGKMNLSVYKIESNPHADKLELLEDATALGIQELPNMEKK